MDRAIETPITASVHHTKPPPKLPSQRPALSKHQHQHQHRLGLSPQLCVVDRRSEWSVPSGLFVFLALVAGWGSSHTFHSLHSPTRGWQPLAVTTRLTCVYTEQSSHRLAHEACSVDRPSHRRFANRHASEHPKRRAWMHHRCAVSAETRLPAQSLSFLGCLKLELQSVVVVSISYREICMCT